jgi:hypothetical protein
MPIRAAFYIDGFNAYHALDGLNKPHLKWLDWVALATLVIPSKSESLVRTVICTAIKSNDALKQARHRRYIAALESKGAHCLRGHFADDPRKCRDCGNEWAAPVEKQGDVNLAISIINDAHRGVFDHCYLVTADGDQAATARMLKSDFPAKQLTSVILPGQRHNKFILSYGAKPMTLNEAHLERSLFPKLIQGAQAILRPTEYDPPGE